MIRVGRATDPDAVFIGRPSTLGNPFVIGVHGGRDEVCDQYERWLEERLKEKDWLVLAAFKQLWERSKAPGGMVLGCYCAPLRCHGDSIKRVLEDDVRMQALLIDFPL